MKKLIFSIFSVVTLATFAEDNYQALYWQVTADSLGGYSDAAYANLYATLNGDRVVVDENVGGASGFSYLGETLNETLAINLNGWNGGMALDGAMFFVELLNEGGGFMAQSAGISYANILPHIGKNLPGSDIPMVDNGPAIFSAYAVPEPTSGLLMLLGIAGLALRRKRA